MWTKWPREPDLTLLIREHCTADLLYIPVYSLRSISQYKLVGQLTSPVLLFFLWTVRHEVLVLYSRLNGYIQIYPNILGSILQNISKYEIRSRKQIRSRVTLLKSSFHNNLTSFSFLKVALIFEWFSKSLLLHCEGWLGRDGGWVVGIILKLPIGHYIDHLNCRYLRLILYCCCDIRFTSWIIDRRREDIYQIYPNQLDEIVRSYLDVDTITPKQLLLSYT